MKKLLCMLLIAALTLAREGCRVLIVERMNCLGGMGTAGHIEGYYFGSRGGLFGRSANNDGPELLGQKKGLFRR